MQPRDIGLTLIGAVLTALVADIVARRKLRREFPFFFAYLVLSVIVPLVRLSVSGDYLTFFIVFWATEAVYAILTLQALHEVFRKVFFTFYQFWWFRLVFPGVAGIAALVQIWCAILTPSIQAVPKLGVILSFARVVNGVEVVLFCLFFILVLLLGVWVHRYFLGIVTGFGLPALAGLLAFTLRSEFGTKYNTLVKYASPVAYLLGVLVWLDTFMRQPGTYLAQQSPTGKTSGGSQGVHQERPLSFFRRYVLRSVKV